MESRNILFLQAKTLVDRLARLSADSVWARRASGLRASLDKSVEEFAAGEFIDPETLGKLISLGYEMLEKAAGELPVPEDILLKFKSERHFSEDRIGSVKDSGEISTKP